MATIEELDPPNISSSYFDKFKVNLMEKWSNGTVGLVTSLLGVCMGKDRTDKSAKLANFNKSSTSLHIIHVLTDVINCLGLQAEVTQEISFFNSKRLIIVKWIEKLPTRHGEALIPYLKNPNETTTSQQARPAQPPLIGTQTDTLHARGD